MSNTIPTSNDVLRNILGCLSIEYHELEESCPEILQECKDLIIIHTKSYVTAAIEECIESAPSGSSTDTVSYEDVVEALKDCYPLDNIK